MAKKQIFTIIALTSAALVFGAGFGIYTIIKPVEDAQASAEYSSTSNQSGVQLNPSSSDSIPLNGNKPSSDSGGLSVSDSSPNSAQLGSGRQSNTVADSPSNSSSGSSAASFAEYQQYKDKTEVYFGDIQEGNGAVAQKDSQLAVTYKGYLTSGQVFDQSKQGNNGQLQPLLFTLGGGQLIPGFEQGVAGMKAGGSRRVIIPPSLGYGDKAQNGIPANSVLIFDIQLVAVQ